MVECTVLGGLVLDRYLEIETFPERGGDQLILNEFAMAGGCAINMASTFNNLGGCAHVVSYLGDDEVGEDIRDYMEHHGFSTAHVDVAEEPSGYCIILLEQDGERTFLTMKGAEGLYDPSLLQDREMHMRHALVTGYYLLSEQAGDVVDSLETIADNDGLILFDPGPLGSEIEGDIFRRMVDLSDIISVNESEEALVADLIRPDQILAVKKGAKGGSIFYRDQIICYEAVEVPVVDTTGAGDSFDAGFFYGLLAGMDIRAAADLGARCAAFVVGIKGPHGFWTLDE